MATKIKGEKLMCYLVEDNTSLDLTSATTTSLADILKNAKSVAFATSHSLSLSMSTSDLSQKTKDEVGNSASWQDSMPDVLSWSIDSDSVFSTDGDGNNFDDLFTYYASAKKLILVWGLSTSDTVGSGWTANNASNLYIGRAYITSLSAEASVDSYASASVTFTGCGAISKVSTAS